MSVTEGELIDFLKSNNAWWYWDNHKHLALLTSGKVSDFFANCSPIFTAPAFQDRIGYALAPKFADLPEDCERMWVIGSAMCAIGLAQSIAKARLCRAAFTERGQMKNYMHLSRFDLGPKPYVVLCEDVISTGGTTIKTIQAILSAHPDVVFHSEILCIVNRSMNNCLDAGDMNFKIKSIVMVAPNVWEPDAIPEEYARCRAIRPKGHWTAMQEKQDA